MADEEAQLGGSSIALMQNLIPAVAVLLLGFICREGEELVRWGRGGTQLRVVLQCHLGGVNWDLSRFLIGTHLGSCYKLHVDSWVSGTQGVRLVCKTISWPLCFEFEHPCFATMQ